MHTRREFIKLTGAALAVAGFAPSAGASLLAPQGLVSRTAPKMGTLVTVTVAHPDAALAEEAILAAWAEIDNLSAVFDRHDGATAVSELNRAGRLADAPEELLHVARRAKDVHARTGGAFDPTVAPLVDAVMAGASTKELSKAMELVGMRRLKTDKGLAFTRSGMALSLDGVAKGYIVDRVSAVLTAHGAKRHCVNAGGDVLVKGGQAAGVPWTVAIEDPEKRGRYPSILKLYDGAVATSGSYERGRSLAAHHIVAPATGRSPRHAVSASVVAPTVMEADALSTALMVLPLGEGLGTIEAMGRQALVIAPTGASAATDGWKRLA